MCYLMLLVFILMPQLVFASGNALDWLPSNIRIPTNTPNYSIASNGEIDADNKFVVVVWEDNRNGNEDIYCNFSTDGGVNWQASDIRVNTNTAGASRSLCPTVAVCGSRVYVAWTDTRNGYADIYLNYSGDYGQTWLNSDIRLNLGSNPGEKLANTPQVHASGNNVYVTWIETRFGYLEGLFLNYSLNGGANWQSPDVQIDGGAHDVWLWQIIADGTKLYAMWWANGEDIYFNRSLDNGVHWMDAGQHKVNVSDEGYCENPIFSVEGSTIYVFWDKNEGGRLINFNHSEDGGISWDETDNELSFGSSPQMTLNKGVVHLVNLQNSSLYYRQYTSQSGWKSPIIVRGYDVKSFNVPVLEVKDHLVFLAWYDTVCLDESVRYNYSLNRGQNFSATFPPVFLNDNAGEMTARTDDIRIAVSGSYIYVIWKDYRNGKADIYFTISRIPAKVLPFLNLLLD
ncbi:MAG: exo-alpha-sialidase [Bacteroidales bacterium]|nr:exo-alpha-sialidase [Bacteroidales bacterium]